MPVRLWRRPLDADQVAVVRAEVHIAGDRCNGCGFCIDFCPKGVLARSEEVNKKGFYPPRVMDETKCTLCGFCRSVCPVCAIFPIQMRRQEEDEI
jgi:2-oxoglutarate ferredoxin oxidoreductase subunit delta